MRQVGPRNIAHMPEPVLDLTTVLEAQSVDKDACVLRGARLCGSTSLHGRDYTSPALDELVQRYRGVQVYKDHRMEGQSRRSSDELVGWVDKAKVWRDGDCVRGDVHLLESHPLTPRVMEAVNRQAPLFGFSHDAMIRARRTSGGRDSVESVPTVHSLDLVDRPATSRGIFESQETPMTTKTRSQLWEGVADALAEVKRAQEADHELDTKLAESELDRVVFAATELLSQILMEEGGDRLDKAARLAQVAKDLAKKLEASPEDEAPEDEAGEAPPEDGDDGMESATIKQELESLKAQVEAREKRAAVMEHAALRGVTGRLVSEGADTPAMEAALALPLDRAKALINSLVSPDPVRSTEGAPPTPPTEGTTTETTAQEARDFAASIGLL